MPRFHYEHEHTSHRLFDCVSSSEQHPTIYEVIDNGDGTQTFTRAIDLYTSPYYRWDNSVEPKTEEFPPGFRMIAASNDPGADQGGEFGGNMFTECCTDGQACLTWNSLEFPTQTCGFLGIAFGECFQAWN